MAISLHVKVRVIRHAIGYTLPSVTMAKSLQPGGRGMVEHFESAMRPTRHDHPRRNIAEIKRQLYN
jgi:hypothetical protein